MSKVFYDHLIIIDEVLVEIDTLDIDADEKKELKHMVDELMHHRVLARILDLLDENCHEEFLAKFHAAPFDLQLLEYLQGRIDMDIKGELIVLGKALREEIQEDIKSHRRKNNGL